MSFVSVLRPGLKVAAVIATLAMPAALSAQDGEPSPVVATVNGEAITEADLALAAQDFRETLAQLPPDQRILGLINGIIDIRLMARAAETAGLHNEAAAAHRLAFVRDRALRAEYLRAHVFEAITEADLQEAYDAAVADFEPADEIRASHILVESEEEAAALIAELDGGAVFAELAKQNSIDLGSGAAGGDLDFFGRGRMVPPFEAAAFALEPGQYSDAPVRSDFGWHVILVTDKRLSEPPSFAALAPALRDEVARAMFIAEIDRLRADAEIEFVGPEADEDADAPAAP
jgi:peptidyl-prolyl cis-trans isomerase C